jgi:hypothetical protein
MPLWTAWRPTGCRNPWRPGPYACHGSRRILARSLACSPWATHKGMANAEPMHLRQKRHEPHRSDRARDFDRALAAVGLYVGDLPSNGRLRPKHTAGWPVPRIWHRLGATSTPAHNHRSPDADRRPRKLSEVKLAAGRVMRAREMALWVQLTAPADRQRPELRVRRQRP